MRAVLLHREFSMSLTLHFHPLASYCWKALIALYENDIAFTPNLVDLGNAGERAALVKLWGVGKFPVLRDEARNETVPESSIIIEYLDRHIPRPHPLHSRRSRPRLADPAARPLLRSLCASADAEDHVRPDAACGQKGPQGVEEARAQLRTSYAMIEQQMASGGWAMGEDFSLADCAAAPPLFYGSMVVPFGRRRSNLAAYFERLKARPSFVRVMKEAEPYFQMVPKES
jgi:glutathione S-transferase